MNLKKAALSMAIASALSTAITAPVQAAVIDMDFAGLFTMLSPAGVALQNTAYPYYGDSTWGYGLRSQISGTLSFDTTTEAGSGTVAPFHFFNKGFLVTSGVQFQSIGGGLLLGNMNASWSGSITTTNIVLDASGLFSALAGGLPVVGTVFDQAACAGLPCATPASDGIDKGNFPIGPAPIATSSFNVAGDTGFGTTLGQLSLGTDDGIGGSPMTSGAFSGFNANFDMTSLTVTNVSAVPVPSAIWLFGSGSLALLGFARRRKI